MSYADSISVPVEQPAGIIVITCMWYMLAWISWAHVADAESWILV